MKALGIDVGGTAIKGAPVDLKTGQLEALPLLLPTPKQPTPEQVAAVILQLIRHFEWEGPAGCGVPVAISHGKSFTSGGNMHESWIDAQIDRLFKEKTGLSFVLINDADAAGLAEMRHGAGVGKQGLVITVTIGTGLGTGVFYNGQLLPNFELGRLNHTNGKPIELYTAGPVIKRDQLDFITWGKRFNKFLEHLNYIFSPDLFILGGGVSNEHKRFRDALTVKVPVVLSSFKNDAGILGAAMLCHEKERQTS